MGNNNLVLVDTDDLREMIQEAVKEAVNECLPAAIPDEKKFYTIKDVAQKWGGVNRPSGAMPSWEGSKLRR